MELFINNHLRYAKTLNALSKYLTNTQLIIYIRFFVQFVNEQFAIAIIKLGQNVELLSEISSHFRKIKYKLIKI